MKIRDLFWWEKKKRPIKSLPLHLGPSDSLVLPDGREIVFDCAMTFNTWEELEAVIGLFDNDNDSNQELKG